MYNIYIYIYINIYIIHIYYTYIYIHIHCIYTIYIQQKTGKTPKSIVPHPYHQPPALLMNSRTQRMFCNK